MRGDTKTIGSLTLRPGHELLRDRTQVAVGGRTLALISVLAAAEGAVVTKDELLDVVWPGRLVEENALHAQISAARKALGDEAARLVTVHGLGYRLDLGNLQSAPAGKHQASVSVAVLPFENLSADPGNAYLADGLAEELITTLSRTPHLRVPSRTSSFAYRGRAADVRTIGAELGVATVLEGSVRVAGERLRVTAQLIDAESGFHIWAENFERKMGDLLALQDDLAQAIAGAMRRELAPRFAETNSAEAMRLVLEARRASRMISPEALQESVRLARAALELDPGFAKAWESLAGATYVMANTGFAGTQAFSEAAGYAEKAIALNPTLSGPLAILAMIDAAGGRMLSAAERLEHAATVDKGEAMIWEQAAIGVFLPMGLTTRATAYAAESLRLAPSRVGPYLIGALCALAAHDVARASHHLNRALALGQPPARPPVEILQSDIASVTGDMVAAAEPMVRLVTRQLAVPGAAAAVEAVFRAFTNPVESRPALLAIDDLFAASDRSGSLWQHPVGASLIMEWQARLGALDAAFASARRVIERWRETGRLATGCLNICWNRPMTPFRRDPRFQEFIHELNLIPFWQRHGPPDGHRLEGDRLVVL